MADSRLGVKCKPRGLDLVEYFIRYPRIQAGDTGLVPWTVGRGA